jgi:predicted nuclease with RNAse H fold
MRYVGIDVGGNKKGQYVAVLDESGELECPGSSSLDGLADYLVGKYGKDVVVAIDPPRREPVDKKGWAEM